MEADQGMGIQGICATESLAPRTAEQLTPTISDHFREIPIVNLLTNPLAA
jgi:hypothetical protein